MVLEATRIAALLGVVAALANVAGGLDPVGSLLFGTSWTGSSLVAVGLAAVACQLSASARTCAAYAASGLGLLFLLRAVGDVSAGWLSWLSPFGWNTRLGAWSEPRLWVLPLYVVTAAALVALAAWLRSRRDLGARLVADRPGPVQGAPRLADALALAVTVHAAMLTWWTVGVLTIGLTFGAVAPGIGELFDSDRMRDLLATLGGVGALAEIMLGAVLSILAFVVSCFAVAVVGHAAGDETGGRAELVLSTATSRSRWFVATAVVAVGGATWLLLVAGLALTLGYGAAGPGLVTGLRAGLEAGCCSAPSRRHRRSGSSPASRWPAWRCGAGEPSRPGAWSCSS